MLPAVAATIDSIMKPVFGTPTGTGVFPIGGIAAQTPTAKISGKAGLRAAHGLDAAERRQQHREDLRSARRPRRVYAPAPAHSGRDLR